MDIFGGADPTDRGGNGFGGNGARLAIDNFVNGDLGITLTDTLASYNNERFENYPFIDPESAAFFGNQSRQYIDANGSIVTQVSLVGSSGADTLVGSADIPNVFDGEGAPAGSEDYEVGSGDGDTFIYSEGYGSLEISEIGTATNVLQLGAGISESSVTLSGDSAGNVYIADGVSGDAIKLDGMLSNAADGVQDIQFGDGTVWSRSSASASALPIALQANNGTFYIQYGYSMNLIGNSDTLFFLAGDSLTVDGTSDAVSSGGTASVLVTGFATVVDPSASTGGSGITAISSHGGDLLSAPIGNDTLISGGNSDTMVGGSGSDAVIVNGNDVVQLGSGTMTVTSANGAVYLVGASTTTASVGSDNAGGRHYNLVFNNDSSASTVLGGAGSYFIQAGAGGGIYTGGSAGGNELLGGSLSVTLTGGGNNDYLLGSNAGSDLLSAGSGNNITVVSNAANDTVEGGSGTGNIELTTAGDTVFAGSGDNTVNAAVSTMVESGSGQLVLYGGSGASTVTAGLGSTTVLANAGGRQHVAGGRRRGHAHRRGQHQLYAGQQRGGRCALGRGGRQCDDGGDCQW